VELGLKLEWRKIILEGDALEVVQALQREESGWGRNGAVHDAKQQMERFMEWRMAHVHRQANDVAHSLAKFALSLQDEQLWMTDFPSCIYSRVFAEQGSEYLKMGFVNMKDKKLNTYIILYKLLF
jgi:hypothetical protein